MKVVITSSVFRYMGDVERMRTIGEVSMYLNTNLLIQPIATTTLRHDHSYEFDSIVIIPKGTTLFVDQVYKTASEWMQQVVLDRLVYSETPV